MVKIGNIELPEFPLLLAPMEDVSDPPFRALCKEHGADVVYTEFISSEGLIRDAAKSTMKLDIYEKERPVGIQIFGANLVSMLRAVEIVEQSNPDIIDINFGCPVKKVVSKGAGAGILKDVCLMEKLTAELVKRTHLPVTVKTRLGWDHDSIRIVEVAERLQDVGIKALSIHGRTRAQMYKGEADWTLIREVKNNPRMHIPVFGNGDIDSPQKAVRYQNEYGVDGIMIVTPYYSKPSQHGILRHFEEISKITDLPIMAYNIPGRTSTLIELETLQTLVEDIGIHSIKDAVGDFEFSKNSTAQLYESGLIGGKAIAIIPAFDGAENVVSGDVLGSSVKPGLTELVNQRLTPLQEKIETVMVSADQLLTNVNSVFDAETKTNLKGSIAQLKQTITSFETTSNTLNGLLEDNKSSITSTLNNFSGISEDLSEVSTSLADANLKETINGLQSTLTNFDSILKDIPTFIYVSTEVSSAKDITV